MAAPTSNSSAGTSHFFRDVGAASWALPIVTTGATGSGATTEPSLPGRDVRSV